MVVGLHVAQYVVAPMADVHRPGGIGEHDQAVEGRLLRAIRAVEQAVVLPPLSPARLDLVRVVASVVHAAGAPSMDVEVGKCKEVTIIAPAPLR